MPRNVRQSLGFQEPAGQVLAGYLLREGVLMEVPVYLGFLSTRHTEQLVDDVLEAHRRAFARMRADGLTDHLDL
jgi:glutamate-1-semialdehyde aminotransferase